MSRTKAFLLTFLISMLPIVELRGAIPFAAAINTMPRITFIEAFPLAVLGNVLPVPFIILFFRYFLKIFRNVKYIGTILENRWKVIDVEYRKKATLQNIYNNEIYEICYASFYRIC